MSGAQFIRHAALVVGTQRWECAPDGLRLTFKVTRSLRAKPPLAEVSIYNLSTDSRHYVESDSWPVRIEAGYLAGFGQIFAGDISDAWSNRHGQTKADWRTVIKARDGWRAFTRRYVSKSFGPGTPKASAVQALFDAMGLPAASDALAQIQGVYATGTALSGVAADYLDDICTSYGLRWLVQDGEIQILSETGSTTESAVLLSPDTGLIGFPEDHQLSSAGGAKSKAVKGKYTRVVALLNPGLRPGRRVILKSREVSGDFRAVEVRHEGDTHSDKWQSEVVLRATGA
ncbi:MAG: hypothetical protein ACYC6M_13535 [Terriglobales bacterium]